MFTPTKLVVLLTAALSVAAVPSHFARNVHNHREIAARVPQPETANPVLARDMAIPAERFIRKKRAGTGRCNPNTSTDGPKPTVTPPQEPTTTPKDDPKPTPVNPEPTTTPKPSPTPNPTPSPAPTPTQAPDPGNGGGQTYNGQATFYSTGLGACGITNNDGDDIAAVSHLFFDSFPGHTSGNPNKNPMCGKTAKVTLRGKTIYVKLVDRCEACAYGDLDFSPHAFNQIADPAEGRVTGISWQIVD